LFSRVRWLAAGAALGVGASVWGQRKMKAAAARYRPAGLAETALDRARTWPSHLRAAMQEGRTTMRQREAELRQGLQPPARPPRPLSQMEGDSGPQWRPTSRPAR
jgi:hypothetical protein